MLKIPGGAGDRASCFWGRAAGVEGGGSLAVAAVVLTSEVISAFSSLTRLDGLDGAWSRSLSETLRFRLVDEVDSGVAPLSIGRSDVVG